MKVRVSIDPDANEVLASVARKMGISKKKLSSKLLAQMVDCLTEGQIQMAATNLNALVSTKTQTEKMLDLLRSRKQITAKRAKMHGINNPTFNIHQLRIQGHVIEGRWALDGGHHSKNFKIYFYKGIAQCKG